MDVQFFLYIYLTTNKAIWDEMPSSEHEKGQ